MDVSDMKRQACEAIESYKDKLNELSSDIWSHPELNFNEHHAHAALTGFLKKVFPCVEKNYLLDTGFRAEYGQGSPHVAVLCEYDALPGIGHGCGHNLIAEVGVAAGIGIKAAIDAAREAGLQTGKLTVLGTPAEEGGGGKIKMIDMGAFKTFDVAMMCHPFNVDSAAPTSVTATQNVFVKFHGKASHAAAQPWTGVNALDAAVLAYNNVSVLRQQMKPSWRLHGIITDGGTVTNIIPELTQMEYGVRTPTLAELELLKQKVLRCFEAAATATGCRLEVEWHDLIYKDLLTNPTLAKLFEDNATSLGVQMERDPAKTAIAGSTDMGNVSYEVPSIHPCFKIGTDAGNHTREFAAAAGAPAAQPFTVRQAKALAMTVIDVLASPSLVDDMKQELAKQKSCQ